MKLQHEPHVVGRFQDEEVWLATFLDPAGTLHLICEVRVAASAAKP